MKAVLLAASVIVLSAQFASAQQAGYADLVATHARANGVPEALVHRVIMRESRYQAQLVGRGGAIGLMQIKLATARGLGYTGDAAGLRDPNTNLTYAVKYLAGAYRAANGDHSRAVRYYAGGYYYAAKRQHLETTHVIAENRYLEPNGNPVPSFAATPVRKHLSRRVANALAQARRPVSWTP